jgi:tetratricopeptide (TPR) repeat protein
MATRPETAETYLKWLSNTSLAKLNQAQRIENGVLVVLERTLAQLDQSKQNLLAILSLLAMTPVEQGVLVEALNPRARRRLWSTIQRVFKHEPGESEPGIRHVLQELSNYGLISWQGQQCSFSHSLIRSYFQKQFTIPAGAARQLVAYYTMLVGEQILLGMDGYSRLNAERPHIMALLAGCMRRGEWKAAHDLAIAIEDYLDLQGHGTERVIANQIGLTAARRLGRGYNEVAWLGNLGLAYKSIGQVDQAIKYYEQALAGAREVGDQRSEGNWLGNLGLAYRDLDEIDLARQYLNQSLTIFEMINSPSADVIKDWLMELEDV